MIDREFLQEAQNELLRQKVITEEQKRKTEEEEQKLRQELASRGRDNETWNADLVDGIAQKNHDNHALEEKLKDIEAALGRISAGTFGICIDCGKEIPRERLRVAGYFVKRDAPCQEANAKNKPRKYW